MRRVGVKQANPKIAGQIVQVTQERAKSGGVGGKRSGGGSEFFWRGNVWTMVFPQIKSVVGRILGDQIQFLHSFGNQLASLPHHIRLLTAPVRTAHPGNDAEAARMI